MPPNKSKRSTEDSPEERRSKRKKPNDDEEEEDREHVTKASSSKKTPLFTGGGSSHKPAELFRKDLISAMKLPDSEPLAPEDYSLITDTWRQEWERGVQVPVNEVGLPKVDITEPGEIDKLPGDFKIPKKYLHASKDDTYQLGQHELTGMSQLAEQVVRYDLDDLDVSWLGLVNGQREECGQPAIYEWTMERVFEALETNCHDNMEIKKKTEEGLGIEYDEDIVCQICQSPDSEDTNEMVFCDGCDICVHQGCYGIQTVPEGSWLCRTCALGIKPQCILCPKIGGAMKSTRSGTKWAHVSCAIWIPEVTIGCVEKMEPITKISQIPASRWSLLCVICKERSGACIQCTVKACKTAFHVTCAISEKLEMKTVLIEDKNSEDVKLKAYCPKHCKKRDRNSSESETDSPRKSICGTPEKGKEMTEEEKAMLRADSSSPAMERKVPHFPYRSFSALSQQHEISKIVKWAGLGAEKARIIRLRKLEDEFYTVVNTAEVATQMELDIGVINLIFNYWKLKRKSLFNRPLLTPKTEEEDLLEKQQEDSLMARMKMFVHLRQDLERVRNLSYMIGKREKLKRQFARSRESVFYAVLEVLTDKSINLGKKEVDKVVKTYRDLPSPYDDRTAKKVKLAKASKASTEEDGEIDGINNSRNRSRTPSVESTAQKAVKNLSDQFDVKKRKSIQETPKSRLSSVELDSETPKGKVKQKGVSGKAVKGSEGLVTEVKQEVIEVGDQNNSSLDTSETVDVGSEDVNTLVNVSQTSVTDASNIAQSETESFTARITPQPVKRKRGRPSFASLGIVKESKTDAEKDSKSEETPDKVLEVSDDKTEEDKVKPVTKRRPTRTSLPGVVDVELTEDGHSRDGNVGLKDSSEVVEIEPESKSHTTDKPRERRQSAVQKLTDEEKQDLITKFPSAKNVSDHIKAELHGYFKNNKLVVSSKLRDKVQNSLLSGGRRSRRTNGVIIDHSQSKIDSFFVKSPPHYGISEKSPAKNVSRVLNELSPTRDRFEANNVERTASLRGGMRSPELRSVRNSLENGIFSSKEKLFDTGSRHSGSRASSPESCVGSVKSVNSYRSDRLERVRTRSKSPSVTGLLESEVDLENLCGDKRLTRSRVDGSNSRSGSDSPKNMQKSNAVSS